MVDALDGEILSRGKTSGLFSRFASTNLSTDDDAVASREEHQTVQDILNMRPERNYRFIQGKEFDVIKLRYGVSFIAAKYPIIHRIVQANTKEVVSAFHPTDPGSTCGIEFNDGPIP